METSNSVGHFSILVTSPFAFQVTTYFGLKILTSILEWTFKWRMITIYSNIRYLIVYISSPRIMCWYNNVTIAELLLNGRLGFGLFDTP